MGKVIKLVAGYYEKMYHRMFNAATDAIWAIEDGEVEKGKEMLIRAQQDCEEIYISAGEDDETNESEAEDETE